MKAMILAAGLGTRLKPITDKTPKALVEVGGVPMLERIIQRLKKQGFKQIVINVHHFADQIIKFLQERDFGLEIKVSDETESLLDTGGGIIKAMPLLFEKDSAPVLIHNVDILSNADLNGLWKKGLEQTTLLVSERDSSRKLIFDKEMNLKGWHDLKNDIYRPSSLELKFSDKEIPFSGIYTITKAAVEEMQTLMGTGKFSVIEYFLSPLRNEKIVGLEQSGISIIDIGKPATLLQASNILSK